MPNSAAQGLACDAACRTGLCLRDVQQGVACCMVTTAVTWHTLVAGTCPRAQQQQRGGSGGGPQQLCCQQHQRRREQRRGCTCAGACTLPGGRHRAAAAAARPPAAPRTPAGECNKRL